MVPRENKNNAYAKLGGEGNGVGGGGGGQTKSIIPSCL